MKIISLLLILFSIVALASCADKIETPPTTLKSGTIIYNNIDFSNKSKTPDIVIIDTTAKTQLIIGETDYEYFLRGIGSGKIVYLKSNKTAIGSLPPNTRFVVIDNINHTASKNLYRETSNQLLVTNSVTISPNGEKVAYATLDSGAITAQLWVVNVDGTNKRMLSNHFNIQTTPCFSDDGSVILYYTSTNISKISDPCTIESAYTNGTGTNILCAIERAGVDGGGIVAWRHGSSSEAVVTDNEKIYVVNTFSPAAKAFIVNGLTPCWSPDGTKLAYTKTSGSENSELAYTADLGVTEVALTNTNASYEAFPSWSPDGKKILCVTWAGDLDHATTSIKLIDIATYESKIVATPGYTGYFIQ